MLKKLSLFWVVLGCFGLVGLGACGDDDPGTSMPMMDASPDSDAMAMGPQPIDAEPDTWTWVEFPNATCANGETTGIGVNWNPGATKLLLFFEGGGACWDEVTCYGGDGEDPLASNIESGYTAADFEEDRGMLFRHAFSRRDENNPMREFNMVYVPYCTGDVHGGSSTQMYGERETRHVGALNVAAYLERIAVTLPDTEYVMVTGRSAGGFGTLASYNRVATTFPTARVDFIDDSGPAPANGALPAPLYESWVPQWGLSEDVIPADCVGCETSLDLLFSYYADKYPMSRFGMTSYTLDGVIAFFFQQEPAEFELMLKRILNDHFVSRSNLHYFIVPGDLHTMYANWTMITSEGTTFQEWAAQLINDDPAWGSIAPAGFLSEDGSGG